MITPDDFCPVEMKDGAFFHEIFSKFPQIHSENNFSTMIAWQGYSDYSYAYLENTLLISAVINEKRLYHAPIGPRNPALLRDLLRLSAETGGDRPFYVFDRPTRDWILHELPGLALHTDRDFFDYIYLTGDLAHLPGKRYLGMRKHINKFNRNCSYEVETITSENVPEIKEFLRKWCEWKHCEENEVLAHEKTAVLFCVDHFAELGLEGLLIWVDGKISALSIYEGMNDDMALIHFEKGLPDCEGNYKVINQETARYLEEYKGYAFINRESDLGVPGLREAKLRYYPNHFAEVWYAEKKDILRALGEEKEHLGIKGL
ncbi:DUF2156 domain-containing protein [Methanogenium marinum]|nr:phosphatidylglycerol lysyltransferase domain-containing protein [Methanogenium marinum]